MVETGVLADPLLHGLNQEQINAVTVSTEHHTLVLAGAGCGKTTVLTKRIAYCIRAGTDQRKICALTFTRKAAEEMATRVSALKTILKSGELPLITTFHGLGLRLLTQIFQGRPNFTRIGFNKQPEFLSERKRLQLLASISTKQERDVLFADLLKLDSLLAQRSVFPEKLSTLSDHQLKLLDLIAVRLDAKKRECNVWDFSDLLSGLMELFDSYPLIAQHYAQSFDNILVDEFQDTSPLQINILHKLLSEGSSLFAVGDDDQAIYGFRGADIRPTLEFGQYFEGAKILKLQINYRSVPIILETANKLFRNKDQTYRKVLVSGRYSAKDNPARPSIHIFDNMEQLLTWILQKAEILNRKDAIALGEMAVLFRVNQTLNWAEDFLKKNCVKELLCDPKCTHEGLPQLLTIHRSKGLEFPVVFLCDLEESVFPSYRIPAKKKIKTINDLIGHIMKNKKSDKIGCDWEEEKRLFYVAITRAQKYLYFLSARHKLVYGRQRRFEQSSLIKLL